MTSESISLMNIGPGAVIAGRFEIVKRIGAGGMGMVFRAIDRELNNDLVALKLLLPHLAQDENVFRRFLNEVRVARSLSHPNIVRIHDIGKAEGGFHYISMEYVDGDSLKDRISPQKAEDEATHRPLGFEQAVSILCRVLSGVAYAHEKGIIHRDLKPANILISKEGDVKLADFGTARIVSLNTSLTQTGQLIGTPDYMSPEAIRGEHLDAACDIYSLGIIAYEIVAGRCPFSADSPVAVAFKHMSEPIPDFGVPGIPEWYQQIVRKAAAKEKSQRFTSAAEFASAIIDRLPSMPRSTGFFPPERTGNFRTGVSQTQEQPAVNSSATIPAARFELGTTSPEKEQWTLGTSAGESFIPGERSSPAMLWVIALMILGAGGTAGYFAYSGELQFSSKQSIAQRTALENEFLASLEETKPKSPARRKETPKQTSTQTAVPPPAPTAAPLAVTPLPTDEPAAAPLHQETQAPEAAPAATAGPEQSSAASEASAALPAVPPTETPSPSPSPTVAPTPTQIAMIVPETPVPTPLPPEEVTAELAVRQKGESASVRSVEADVVPGLGWQASLRGIHEPSREALMNEVTLNVIAAKSQRLVVKLAPLRITMPEKAGDSVRIYGSFEKLAAIGIEPGEYRLSVIRAGELLASRQFSVTERAPVKEVEEELPPEPLQLSSGDLPPPVGRSGHRRAEPVATPAPVANPVEAPLAESPAAAAQNFGGSMDFGPEGKKRTSFQLFFEGADIKGSADVEGLGTFQVTGRALPRGVELNLQNQTIAGRLSGGRRGNSMRGTFSFSSGAKGTWEVSSL